MNTLNKQGVLLVNLGTPDAPTAPAVKRFLGQFLGDRRVVNMTPLIWYPLLHGVILPIRAPKVARLYQSIWMEKEGGSPLLVYSQRQAQALEAQLGLPVELGMTYGKPSLQTGVEALLARGVENIIVLPLYPQYSGTTTAAVSDGLSRVFQQMTVIPSYTLIRDYYHHPLYIQALAAKVRRSWEDNGRGEYLLCSYHGIPQRLADEGDIYPLHCQETTRLLGEELGLTADQIGMSYQSRFGREAWLQPYTDKTLEQLSAEGVRHLDIISPAFSVDCLETLEEISEQCRELFLQAGGERFTYIECLNDDDLHIDMMESLIRPYLNGQ